MIRVGIEEAIDGALLHGFAGLEVVRIPPAPAQDIALDLWIASLSPADSRRQWPRLKGVKVVQGLWAGIDALRPLIPATVTLCNARGVHDAPTAEWAVTAVLAMQKFLPSMSSCRPRADWAGKDKAEDIHLLSGAARDPVSPVLVEEIEGKTVLIVGYGAIGKAVEARLAPFGARFLRVARTAREGVASLSGLDHLLAEADIVILTAPLTAETRHLMNEGRLARMKPGALLVNAGRGAVVDTGALVAALNAGPGPRRPRRHRSRAAAAGPSAVAAPNLLITPHVATDTPRFLKLAFDFAAAQAQRYARGEPLENIIAGEY